MVTRKIFIIMLLLLPYLLSAQESSIPSDARQWQKGWSRELRSKTEGTSVTEMWNQNRRRTTIGFSLGSHEAGIGFHPNGTISKVSQVCLVYDCGPESCGGGQRVYGKILEFYDSGQLKREHCESPDFMYYTGYGQQPGVALCGNEIEYNPDGSIKYKKEHRKCKIPCARFQPFIRAGEYPVSLDTKVRKDVGLEAHAIDVIKKGTKVKVVRDTQKISTIYGITAPWVEIEYGDGKKGFMFGGLLEFLVMDTKGFDFATLLNVKRIDKIQEYCYIAEDEKGNPLKVRSSFSGKTK